jgi:L-threonylcarbamoyladenylate synthase
MTDFPRRFTWRDNGLAPDEVSELRTILGSGGLVAYPTDTFYGLGVHPEFPSALEKLYTAKGRDRQKPISLIVSGFDVVQKWAEDLPPAFFVLSKRFWPGPLTLVLRTERGMARGCPGFQETIALRFPASKPACLLAELCGGAVTATSANLAGKPECREPDEVCRQLGAFLDAVLDAGSLEAKRPSTIVDLTGENPEIVREGAVDKKAVEETLRPRYTRR